MLLSVKNRYSAAEDRSGRPFRGVSNLRMAKVCQLPGVSLKDDGPDDEPERKRPVGIYSAQLNRELRTQVSDTSKSAL